MKSCITINLKKDDIVIKINEDFSQEDIMYSLRKKIPELKKLYQSEKTPIVITGKVLKNREIDEIQELIKKHFDVKIKFDSPRTLGLHGITKTYCKEIATSETKFHRGSVRSGQKVEFEGSLVILGDVNDGAEVIAGENIIVLGDLRGLAHAGAKGNKERQQLDFLFANVPCLNLEPADWIAAGTFLQTLRARGITLPLTDAVIAAIAQRCGVPVLTIDAHFQHLPVTVL